MNKKRVFVFKAIAKDKFGRTYLCPFSITVPLDAIMENKVSEVEINNIINEQVAWFHNNHKNGRIVGHFVQDF